MGEVVNEHAARPLPPIAVDRAGFQRLHRVISEALIEHAAATGQKPYRFSERYDVAVRTFRKLAAEQSGT